MRACYRNLARLARSGCHRLESGIEEEQLFAGIPSLGKIQKGIAKLDDGKRRHVIQTWTDQDIRKRFDGRVVLVDREIVLEWGRVCGEGECDGLRVRVIDSLLAATAVCRNLVLASCNVKDSSLYSIKGRKPLNGGGMPRRHSCNV